MHNMNNMNKLEELERLESQVWKKGKEKPKKADWYLVWIKGDVCPCSKFWSGFDWVGMGIMGDKVKYWREMPKGPEKKSKKGA